jgi:hypothetical protein
MEEGLIAYLLADAGVAALVATRVYWLRRPQGGALPSITLQIVSTDREYTQAGREGLVGYLVQIDVWGATFKSMKQVQRAVIAALDSLSTTPFQGAFIESERETAEDQDGPDATTSTTFYRASVDVRVWHAAAV